MMVYLVSNQFREKIALSMILQRYKFTLQPIMSTTGLIFSFYHEKWSESHPHCNLSVTKAGPDNWVALARSKYSCPRTINALSKEVLQVILKNQNQGYIMHIMLLT